MLSEIKLTRRFAPFICQEERDNLLLAVAECIERLMLEAFPMAPMMCGNSPNSLHAIGVYNRLNDALKAIELPPEDADKDAKYK